MKKFTSACVMLGLIVGCSDSSNSESPTDAMTDSQTGTENTATDTNTNTNTNTDTSTPENNTGTVANAASLIGRWQFCIPSELLDADDDRFASLSQGIVFSEDGIFRGYSASYQEPDCQGEETFIPPGLDPIENEQRYTVLGTATSSEGLSVFEVLTQLEGSVDDITYYNIDGNTLLVAEDLGTGVGITTAFNQPYIRQ